MKFHGYFRDGAIVQRGVPVTVVGYAEGEVHCRLHGEGYHVEENVVPKGGVFRMTFPPVTDTAHEYVLSARCDGEEIAVRIRFGDVYLAAGQSNMSYSLGSVEESETWLKRASDLPVSVLELAEPPFRSLEELTRPFAPQSDLAREYTWKTGEELLGCSALAAIAATLLSERNHVPVGFVQTAMGGLSIEAYLRREDVERDPELVSFLKRVGRFQNKEEYNRAGERNYSQLSGVWNEKIAPLKEVPFAGVVWLLGESSAWDFPFAQMFGREMKLLIGALEETFGEIPVSLVHIAPEYYPYGDGFGYLYINEALTAAEKFGRCVVSVPVYDIEPRWLKTDGELYYHPIHPVNKAPIALRIADALCGGTFPAIKEVHFERGKAVCILQNVKEGMKEGEANGFTLAGENGKYYPARAKVVAPDRIEVSSEDVPNPRALTYAFLQYQDFCNGRRKDGAPLLPYRTDREPVDDKYCFTPAYTVTGAAEVYENCFGWQVGTCRKRKVWEKGNIYDGGDVQISVGKEGVVCRATPNAESYFLFGISPAICLSGHKNHIADYAFWNLSLQADREAEFLGVVVRAASGEVFRFDLFDGKEKVSALPLGKEERRVAVSLKTGERGDLAPVRFSKKLRKSFVQAEFLFRAKEPATVTLSRLSLSDTNRSVPVLRTEGAAQTSPNRADTVLPT